MNNTTNVETRQQHNHITTTGFNTTTWTVASAEGTIGNQNQWMEHLAAAGETKTT
jgi:hypothetical protein